MRLRKDFRRLAPWRTYSAIHSSPLPPPPPARGPGCHAPQKCLQRAAYIRAYPGYGLQIPTAGAEEKATPSNITL